jgi:hypothetical protein
MAPTLAPSHRISSCRLRSRRCPAEQHSQCAAAPCQSRAALVRRAFPPRPGGETIPVRGLQHLVLLDLLEVVVQRHCGSPETVLPMLCRSGASVCRPAAWLPYDVLRMPRPVACA